MRKHSLTRKTKETDITVKISLDGKGANNIKCDSLFIINGIHKNEFLNIQIENYDEILKKYKTETNYYQERLTW